MCLKVMTCRLNDKILLIKLLFTEVIGKCFLAPCANPIFNIAISRTGCIYRFYLIELMNVR